MEIGCHPVSGDHTSNTNIQKEAVIPFQTPVEIFFANTNRRLFVFFFQSRFSVKRTFLLFACLYDMTIIDKSFGSGTVAFELSLGSGRYLSLIELCSGDLFPSLSVSYPLIPMDLQKSIVSTKHIFHDYSFQMVLSNQQKRAANHLARSSRRKIFLANTSFF